MAGANGGINVVFNGYSLQTANILVNSIDHDTIPVRTLAVATLARTDGSRITNAQYTQKVVKVGGSIIGSNIPDLESRIDAFKQNLYGSAQNLDIDYNGSTRRYVATAQTQSITRSDALFKVDFALEFLCVDPWGRDTASTTLTLGTTTITASPTTSTVTMGGTAPLQRPVLTLLVNSLSGASMNTITITNPATGVAISIARTWTAADSLVVDTLNRSVKVNGVAVDYTGMFPTWAPGSGNIQISDDFTSRNMTLSGSNLNIYL